MKHNLKIQREYYEAIQEKRKTFEIRKDDREYSVGDLVQFLVLPELEPSQDIYEIAYLSDYKQRSGYVVFSIKKVSESQFVRYVEDY